MSLPSALARPRCFLAFVLKILIHFYSPCWIEVFFLPGLLMGHIEHLSFLPLTCLAGRCPAQDLAAFVKSWDEGWGGAQGALSTGPKRGCCSRAGPSRWVLRTQSLFQPSPGSGACQLLQRGVTPRPREQGLKDSQVWA